jgi:nucleotide-binding universal stress UspA family protein
MTTTETTSTETTSTETTSAGPTARIVVGVDGSEQSKDALRWAARIAPAFGAQLHAVAVWHIPLDTGWQTVPGYWNPKQDMEKCLTETVDQVFGTERPAGLELSVVEGQTAHAIIEASEGALMLIVGSRGHGGFAGLLLGSVSASLAEHAGCPVLVVHGDQIPPAAA